MSITIDLNADVGELPEALADGSEAALIAQLTSVNIACGGHAGDAASMQAVVAIARRSGVAIGAHPSFPDREGFGRRPMTMAGEDLASSIRIQVTALDAIARQAGGVLRHVKPHGALYNAAARDPALAATIAGALVTWRDRIVLVGLAGSTMLQVWRDGGFRVAAEAFADRRYEPDGSLRARAHPDALIDDVRTAAEQAVEIALHRRVRSVTGALVPIDAQTLCIHGDTPGAARAAAAIRSQLESAGVRVAGLG